MKLHHVLIALAASAVSTSVSAQNMKPGLWEVTNNVKSASGDMERAQAQAHAQMASMSPEERKMVQEMMAKHGVKMAAGGLGSSSVKVCMTKDMVERNQVPAQHGDCKTTTQQRTGNTMKIAFTCTNPPSKGEGQMTFVSAEAYRMNMTITNSAHGNPETMNMDTSGKWLSADCGNIKPIRAPNAK